MVTVVNNDLVINKAFAIPASDRIDPYYADEMKRIWRSDTKRNWKIYDLDSFLFNWERA